MMYSRSTYSVAIDRVELGPSLYPSAAKMRSRTSLAISRRPIFSHAFETTAITFIALPSIPRSLTRGFTRLSSLIKYVVIEVSFWALNAQRYEHCYSGVVPVRHQLLA